MEVLQGLDVVLSDYVHVKNEISLSFFKSIYIYLTFYD